METEYIPPSVMTIFAHPDDQEFTVAGTLARWACAGSQITAVLLTSGDAGSNDPGCGPFCKEELAQLREAEQLSANAVLGIQETVFLRYPDGILQHTLELRKAVTRQIRRYRPEVVVCGDPTVRFFGTEYMNHPDHRVAADVACDAVFPSAGTRLIFPELLEEGFEPHNVKYVYLSSTDQPNTWIDTADTLALKVEALRKHASQLRDWDPTDEMRKWASESGKAKGITAAEAFRVMALS
ncbi:MAG: PIG-L deacetylase family protein [Chloroflexota bacterium]